MFTNKQHLKLLLVGMVSLGLLGCGSGTKRGAKVSGTVVVDGELAHSGTVTFHPTEPGPLAVGRILADGSFTVRTGQGDLSDVDGGTVTPGEYKVTIVVTAESGEKIGESGPPKAGPRLTAAKYASSETSGLVRTVNPGDNLFVFKLEGAASDIDDVPSEEPEADATSDSNDEPATEGESPSDSPAEEEEQS
ncbi:hypothetical protein [Aeoliella sp.]|uniref:hypothetical protein n=1 Tax=Aeoliella sp. TaxID=2795800 RepID=UPI003CCB8418